MNGVYRVRRREYLRHALERWPHRPLKPVTSYRPVSRRHRDLQALCLSLIDESAARPVD